MRGHDHPGAPVQGVVDAGQYGPDTGIVSDVLLHVQGDVEIHPEQHPLAFEVDFPDGLHEVFLRI